MYSLNNTKYQYKYYKNILFLHLSVLQVGPVGKRHLRWTKKKKNPKTTRSQSSPSPSASQTKPPSHSACQEHIHTYNIQMYIHTSNISTCSSGFHPFSILAIVWAWWGRCRSFILRVRIHSSGAIRVGLWGGFSDWASYREYCLRDSCCNLFS